jgi:hypothetical protein
VCTGGKCAAPRCDDKVGNGAESDVDCGGTCTACSPGARCKTGSDCTSRSCAGNTCRAADCTDGIKNGAETGTDCGGGACPKCGVGGPCSAASDCTTGVCATTCQAPTAATPSRTGPKPTSIAAGRPVRSARTRRRARQVPTA